MKSISQARLYTFVDSSFLKNRDPIELARKLIDGGSDIIQLRAKDWPESQILKVGEQLMKILEPAGIPLVINDKVLVALALKAPFVHIGQEEFFGAGYTHVDQLDPYRQIQFGISTHSPSQALCSVSAGAAYISVGPIWHTSTKPSREPTGTEFVRWAHTHIKIPWFAIGGITLENLPKLIELGVRRIAVISAILNQEDIVGACKRFKSILESVKLE